LAISFEPETTESQSKVRNTHILA